MLPRAMRLLAPLLLSFVAASALSGCLVESACTEEARSSVTVTVVDASGAPVTDALVSYSVGGAPAKDCEVTLDSGNVFVCGYEEAGNFGIAVTRGAETKTQAVTVSKDECHVISQSITIQLST
jgi:hypothetical protein